MDDDALVKYWKLSGWSYWLQAYFLFMLAWTTSVFANIQKCMIGGVVSRWYFFRQDAAYGEIGSPSLAALQTALTGAFGQVCFGGLVLSFVRFSRCFFKIYRQIANSIKAEWIRSGLNSIGLFFGFLEKVLEHVTDFAIYYVSLTGEG